MKIFYPVLTTMLCFVFVNLSAQQHIHLSSPEDNAIITERLLANKKYVKENGLQERDDMINYVPIKYHIVRKDDGTSGVSEIKLMEMHCALNDYFNAPDGLQFYIKDGLNYIDNTTAYEEHSSVAGESILQQNRDPQAINIFIPKDANPDPFSGGNLLGYYTALNDWLVIRKSSVDGDGFTTPLIMGHFFSLLKPYNGWSFDSWENWVSINGTNIAPEYSPDGVLTEKMDGSNCEVAGDYLCDTPPSYNFFTFFNSCTYDGDAMDPDGVPVDPDENNIMDVFQDDNCPDKYFSEEQFAIMQADYDARTQLHTDWSPPATLIEETTTLISPEESSTTPVYSEVYFEWEEVEGADRYFLEIDRLSDFTLNPTKLIVTETFATVSDIFQADKTYHWRVIAFNDYYTCVESVSSQFTSGIMSNAENVLPVENLTIQPNPTTQNYIVVSLDTENSFDAEITIMSTIGQAISSDVRQFHVGHNDIEIGLEAIPNGIYFINIRSGNQLINKKIIVNR